LRHQVIQTDRQRVFVRGAQDGAGEDEIPSGPVKENSATTARIGFDSGMMISIKMRKLLAPSMRADSSRSFGIASRYLHQPGIHRDHPAT
jgi:hypothetical protein